MSFAIQYPSISNKFSPLNRSSTHALPFPGIKTQTAAPIIKKGRSSKSSSSKTSNRLSVVGGVSTLLNVVTPSLSNNPTSENSGNQTNVTTNGPKLEETTGGLKSKYIPRSEF